MVSVKAVIIYTCTLFFMSWTLSTWKRDYDTTVITDLAILVMQIVFLDKEISEINLCIIMEEQFIVILRQ